MDKKKIQIIIIVVCILVTLGVLYYGFFSDSSSLEVPEGVAPINTNVDSVVDVPEAEIIGTVGNIPTLEAKIQYTAPSTFPENATLDLDVFENSKFQSLQDYTPLNVTPEEIGRENPFDTYQ